MSMRATSERLPHRRWPQVAAGDCGSLQMISLIRRTIILGVFAPPSSQKLLVEAEIARNSFSWKILRVTSLL
jgi:hypothetical protein